VNLRHFKPYEFDLRPHGGEDWWSRMSSEILLLVDEVREQHGAIIEVSPHVSALGRYLGLSFSDHNFDRWKEVRAIDVFPAMDQTSAAALKFLGVCKKVGVGAIGCYPHWTNKNGLQQIGFHLGYRPERTDNPALWGMIRYKKRGTQHMVPIHTAMELAGRPPMGLA
jgi:hypothetical protein